MMVTQEAKGVLDQPLARRHFTVDEYYRMMEAGILNEDDRVELIQGEIIVMSPIGTRHTSCVKRLIALFSEGLGRTAIISVQDPISIGDDTEPQPDIAILKPRDDFYAEHHPGPDDILLVIEVADSSIGYDREYKVPLYANAGITELWIVDLTGEAVQLFAQPENGEYRLQRIVKRGDSFQFQADKTLTIPVDTILS